MPRDRTLLVNKSADMKIGITTLGIYHDPALYIQEGRNQRIIATFLSWEKAEMFIELLKKWDSHGGGDE